MFGGGGTHVMVISRVSVGGYTMFWSWVWYSWSPFLGPRTRVLLRTPHPVQERTLSWSCLGTTDWDTPVPLGKERDQRLEYLLERTRDQRLGYPLPLEKTWDKRPEVLSQPPPQVDKQSENITFPRTSYAGGKNAVSVRHKDNTFDACLSAKLNLALATSSRISLIDFSDKLISNVPLI